MSVSPTSRSLDLSVVTAPGLEPVTLRELAALDVRADVEEAGVIAVPRADQRTLQRLNLHLRTATRVLVRAARFHAASFSELERRARDVPWERAVRADRPVRFRVTCRKSRLYHSDAVAERLATAVQRRLGAEVEWSSGGEGDTRADALADAQLVVVRLFRDECTVSFDSSGAALHARGYREAVAKAPLRETLAAALLLAGEWDPGAPLVDPMCGSGTIAIEAALLARRIAPGLRRGFAFEWWPDVDAASLAELRAEAEAAILPAAPARIVASDRDAGAVAATRGNAERAGVADDLLVRQAPLSALEPPPGADGWVVTNPPYGVRVGEGGTLHPLYARLGSVLRERCGGWHLVLLSADPRLERATQLRLEERFRTRNGGIPVRCVVARVPAGRAPAAALEPDVAG